MAGPISVIPFPKRARPCAHAKAGLDCEHCNVRLVAVCSALEHEELHSLEKIAHTLCFAPKETLFLENDVSDSAYTVTRGVIRLYRIFHDGRRQVIGFLLPGDFIAIEESGKHQFAADAITETSLCHYPAKEFHALLDDKPHLLKQLYLYAAHELISGRDHMMALGQRSAQEKIAWFLIYLRNRWARIQPASDELPLPMSRQDIADFLGLTIETVSRTLSKMAQDDIITILPHGVRLTNTSKIERLAAA